MGLKKLNDYKRGDQIWDDLPKEKWFECVEGGALKRVVIRSNMNKKLKFASNKEGNEESGMK